MAWWKLFTRSTKIDKRFYFQQSCLLVLSSSSSTGHFWQEKGHVLMGGAVRARAANWREYLKSFIKLRTRSIIAANAHLFTRKQSSCEILETEKRGHTRHAFISWLAQI